MLSTMAWELGASGTFRGSFWFHGPHFAKPLVGLGWASAVTGVRISADVMIMMIALRSMARG